jgi:hypothetical protein
VDGIIRNFLSTVRDMEYEKIVSTLIGTENPNEHEKTQHALQSIMNFFTASSGYFICPLINKKGILNQLPNY